VDEEEKVSMELIVSAHLLEQISQVANTGDQRQPDPGVRQ
jgi:hypothetical protein